MGTIDLERLLTSAEVCALLAISKSTLKRWIRKGAISYIRLSSGANRFRPTAVALFIAQLEILQDGVRKKRQYNRRPKPALSDGPGESTS
jgi:excisionase family DNA binding protein